MGSRRIGREDRQDDSRLLYQICCDLGLSPEGWQRRMRICDIENSSVSFLQSRDDNMKELALFCGSYSEGIGMDPESDIDIVLVLNGTTVTEQTRNAIQQPNVSPGQRDHVFETIPSRHPAFVRLQLVAVGNRAGDNIVMTPDYCRSDIDGRFVLSSSDMRVKLQRSATELTSPSSEHGPAQSLVYKVDVEPGFTATKHLDFVLGLQCNFWPSVLSNWISRRRRYNWPPADMIRQIVDHGCEVVPVGDLMSPYQDTEWRLSSSVAEKTLIRSFNIIQIQCYFLLKLTLTYLIKSQVPGTLCSYHIKNVMLYAVEDTDPREWTEENLSRCFETCLRKLHGYIQGGYCPHYFIPEQNLFDPKVQGEPRRRLDRIVGEFLIEGWRIVLKCPPFICSECDNCIPRCPCIIDLWNYVRTKRTNTIITSNSIPPVRMVYQYLSRCLSTSLLHSVSVELENIAAPDEPGVYFPCSNAVQTIKKLLKSHLGFMLLTATRGKHASKNRGVWAILKVAQHFIEVHSDLDVASGRLKLATFFYQTGQIEKCVHTVRAVLRDYTDATVPLCTDDGKMTYQALRNPILQRKLMGLHAMVDDAEALLHHMAFPVMFSPWEILSAPAGVQGLVFSRHLSRYERTAYPNLIIIDPLVYAHYLLVISQLHLGNYAGSRQSLETLARLAGNPTENVLYYPDVARQLLDHCVERISLHDK